MPILVIGDLHCKPQLSYAEYIKDRREGEKQEILDFIVKQAENCEYVVFLGDGLNGRTNAPEVIKEFTNFIEKFDGKEVFIIKGNHESLPGGKSAIDFLKEIKGKRWHIITNSVEKHQLGPVSATFCPYFTKAELDAKDNSEALALIMEKLTPADLLFHHHTMGVGGKIAGLPLDINQLPEPVLPIEKLNKIYKQIIGGHIHKPTTKLPKAIVAGSIFTSEVGEGDKYVWKINETLPNWEASIEQITLPGRAIYKLENPVKADLEKLPTDSIVKAIITKKISVEEMDELKKILKRFDAFIILERIPRERKKMHFSDGESIIDFNIDKLLETYAKDQKIDLPLLKHGFDLIRE